MAAYAALVSVMNTMEQIMNHPRLSTSFEDKQIESVRENVDFLLDFIQSYSSHRGSKEAQDLESQIASAAYSAEDKVIEEMDSVKGKVINVKEETRFMKTNVQLPYSIPTAPTSSKPLTTAKMTMVGFDEELIQLMDVLTGQKPSRQIISIVGMGGIGKTTLSRNAFENPLIMQHFDIRGWVTISHNYSVRQILLELLSCKEIKETLEASDSEILDQEPEDELGVKLHQSLSGRRYLVILDDIWSVECWDKMKFFFPDYDNGSRVVVTTRLSNVATQFSSSRFEINFLDGDKSWDLFCRTAFHEEDCPLELEEVGREIVRKCKGLPLSIVVMGSFLGKSIRAKEYWESVVRDMNSILKSDEDELCLNLLSLSYSHLPAHLKPCFLYMGILQEDQEIHVSRLIKLFVAEGFLKPNEVQSLEEIAEDYLKDLVDRNLILVSKWRWDGTARFYYIHDLLREVCLREAEKEKFLHVMSVLNIPRGVDMEPRRIVVHNNTSEQPQEFDDLPSAALVRSLILKGGPLPLKSRLLKVLTDVDSAPLEAVFEHVNLRYLLCEPSRMFSSAVLPSSASLLWNVQTLIIRGDTERVVAPSEIWSMRQLRHLEFNEVCLPAPPPSKGEEEYALQNLQTLTNVVNFTFNEDVYKRITNIKKLHIGYDDFSDNCLDIDLRSLHQLQSLKCSLDTEAERGDLVLELQFPSSIKKLSLIGGCLHLDNVTTIGTMLPHLEVLKLDWVLGPEWNLVEGAFPRLKFLSISNSDLIYWIADRSHFPVLERLDLRSLAELDEIPSDIGEIPTLRYLNLWSCSESAAISSTKILEEQLNLDNEDIEVRVNFKYMEEEISFMDKVEVENFPKKNFHCTSISRKIYAHAQALRAALLFHKAAGGPL
ncbi:hypothetical protein C2S51_018577 [Perilla frutescens var. frutescens]|nr:hypothetical protein C2S51_018577 [Perilla frutescens var. frutescens]